MSADADKAVGHKGNVFRFNRRHDGEIYTCGDGNILIFIGNDHLAEFGQIPHRKKRIKVNFNGVISTPPGTIDNGAEHLRIHKNAWQGVCT